MDIKQTEITRIELKLNEEFNRSGRRIVFWYDDSGRFGNILSELSINAKKYRLEKDNTFETKYLLEIEDTKSNYLIYAPFAKPLLEDNHLADTILYSALFSADAFQMFIAEMHVPEKYTYVMQNNKKVFDAVERRQRFSDLQIENWSEETIELAILCVIVNAKTVSFDEIIKCIFMEKDDKKKYIAEFERYNVTEIFWKYTEKIYGYRSDNKNLENFQTSLLITYATSKLSNKDGFGGIFKQYLCDKSNNCEVFVCNFMNSIQYGDKYNEIAQMVEKRANIANAIAKMATSEFITCDAFEDIDKEIINRCINELQNNFDENCFYNFSKERLNYHFCKKYIHEYKCLSYAYSLLKIIGEYSTPTTLNDAITQYRTKYYKVDRSYRKFYFHFDLLSDNSIFEKIKECVESRYTNDFLRKCTLDWSKFAPEALESFSSPKQQTFYKKYVRSFKDRCIVIISDAFRYECATELVEKFNECSYDSNLEYLLSTVPSYTQLGMAALLPNDHITMDANNDYKVFVDGQPCGDVVSRNKILCSANKDSIAINYNDVHAMKKVELKAAFKGKNVVYIYHDQIDARGEKTATENEVFNACDEAINEIATLIKRLTGNISSTNYIVTSDHGFIYKRDKIEESDKVLQDISGQIVLNKRYILSQGNVEIEGTKCLPMNYLLGQSAATCVTVPLGADVFKVKGGGQNFVHGGCSLQEMIIPVLKVHTPKTVMEPNSVEIALLSLSRTISNLIMTIEIIQTQKISDEIMSATFKLVFETENGEVITNEELLVADKKDEKPENRIFRKRFVFKEMKYKKSDKYYLVIRDAKTGEKIDRLEFMIDIIFSGGFGFNK